MVCNQKESRVLVETWTPNDDTAAGCHPNIVFAARFNANPTHVLIDIFWQVCQDCYNKYDICSAKKCRYTLSICQICSKKPL